MRIHCTATRTHGVRLRPLPEGRLSRLCAAEANRETTLVSLRDLRESASAWITLLGPIILGGAGAVISIGLIRHVNNLHAARADRQGRIAEAYLDVPDAVTRFAGGRDAPTDTLIPNAELPSPISTAFSSPGGAGVGAPAPPSGSGPVRPNAPTILDVR